MHFLLSTSAGVIFALLFLAIFLLTIYFLPSIVGFSLQVVHLRWIFWANLLLGWTVIGWIAVTIWVLMDRPKNPEIDTWPD